QIFNTRILPQCLNECADCILRREVHFFLELLKAAGSEPLFDPLLIRRQLKNRNPAKEDVGAEAVKGRKPTTGKPQGPSESVDVGRARRNHSPAENTEPCRHVDSGYIIYVTLLPSLVISAPTPRSIIRRTC